jgi:hypothetical protein
VTAPATSGRWIRVTAEVVEDGVPVEFEPGVFATVTERRRIVDPFDDVCRALPVIVAQALGELPEQVVGHVDGEVTP